MHGGDQGLARVQRDHWEQTYTAHPGMYGCEPSSAALQRRRGVQDGGCRTGA